MIVIQFRKHLLHDSLAVEDRLGSHPKLLTITVYGSQFTIIQIDDLPMLSDKGFLLFLQIFRIDSP